MLDIGIWEFLVLGVLALLVFGPDRLPKAAAEAGRLLRTLRQTAANARGELSAAAGLDEGGDLSSALSDLRDLDPRKIAGDLLTGEPEAGAAKPKAARPPAAPSATPGAVPGSKPAPATGDEADPDWT